MSETEFSDFFGLAIGSQYIPMLFLIVGIALWNGFCLSTSPPHQKWPQKADDGQARSRFELIDFPDSNPYPPIEAALPDRAAMLLRSAK